MKKPKLNNNLEVNRFGQLIQWKDSPEIISGVKVVTIWERLGLISIKFNIVENQLKGL